MDISKLNDKILGMPDTSLSSDIETLYPVPSFDLHTNNLSALYGGLCPMWEKRSMHINWWFFSIIYEHLETIIVSISVGEVSYIIGSVYRPSNSSYNAFMPDVSYIINTAFLNFPNYFFNNCWLQLWIIFHQLKQKMCAILFTISVSSSSKTFIDNVWTNNVAAVKNSGVILSQVSDNFPMFVNHHLANNLLATHLSYEVWIRNRACFDKLCAKLNEVNWDEICSHVKASGTFN